jgi:squalene-associated FAD-dependent desaturase
MKLAVIGAGWAGLAAAVVATEAGQNATVFEASDAIGGRARALKDAKVYKLPNGQHAALDNGQHILIGAYTETLRLMRAVGLQPDDLLLNLPLTLQFPDGQGLQFKDWPTPLDALGGILSARGWSLADKASLIGAAVRWQLAGFECAPDQSVAQLCRRLSARVITELVEPLCVSALNTPADQASAQVFLRVLRDTLFGGPGGSRLLLPKVDLSQLFPNAAANWLSARGSEVRLGQRVRQIGQQAGGWLGVWAAERSAQVKEDPAGEGRKAGDTEQSTLPPGFLVNGEAFDAVLLATPPHETARLLTQLVPPLPVAKASQITSWLTACSTLHFEAIATVYAWAEGCRLARPMLALHSTESQPAQFVFDRGQLGGTSGLLAFVVSAAQGERATLQAQVLAQAQSQLGLTLQAVQTVVEKRATFACTPGLQRPSADLLPGLMACGDYIAGPYPATLEGAVRSGINAALSLHAGG